jgi:aryl-alcohol dehydrogenase-like predicted oxidoreductase
MHPIPPIVVGTARIGSVLPDGLVPRRSRETVFRYLDALTDLGCTAFDLAASYQLGGTERLFGAWIGSRRNRNKLFLISKGAHPYPIVRPNRLQARAISSDLDATLRRLGIETLDLYLLHKDFPGAPLERMVEALVAGNRLGKFHAWGVSNWTAPRIQALDALGRRSGLPPMAASSPHFSLVDWVSPPWTGSVSIAGDAGREERAFYARTQLHVLAWSPLGSGFLSNHGRGRAYASPSNAARRRRTQALAERRGATPSQMGLAYLFSQPFPVSAVVSASKVEKMGENLEAASMRLSSEEMRVLEGDS